MKREYRILCLLILITIFFTRHVVFAANYGDSLKQIAVKALGGPSSGYGKQLNDYNVTQAFKSTMGSALAMGKPVFASQLAKTTFGSLGVVKTISAGTQALGTAINNPVGTAKIAAKSALVGGASLLGGPAAGIALSKTNLEQSVRDFGAKTYSAGTQALGAAMSNPVGTAKIVAKSALVGGAIVLGKPVFASQLAKTNIGQSASNFGAKVISAGQNIGSNLSQQLSSVKDSITITGMGFNTNAYETTAYVATKNGGVGVGTNAYGTTATISGKNSSTTYIKPSKYRDSYTNVGNGAF